MTKEKTSNKANKEEKKERLKPISLYPLVTEEALKNLFEVKQLKKKKKTKK